MKIIRLIKLIFSLPGRLFSKISVFARIDNSNIHKTSAVFAHSRVYSSNVGKYTYIASGSIICKTTIGNYCSIAANVVISPGKHPLYMVSTSPVFYSAKNNLNTSFNIEEFEEFDKTIIGNDVWIGINAFIKGGISIGDGAVIGAYSVVTRDVEPYSIVAGNPAKLIRKRFNNSEIEKLLEVKWWNEDEINIKKKARHFKDIRDFFEHY